MLSPKIVNRIPSLAEPCGVVGGFSSVVMTYVGMGIFFFLRQYTVLYFLLLRLSHPQRKKNTQNSYIQGKLFFNLV